MQSEEHLNDMQAIAGIGSWQINLSSGAVTISQQLRHILGLPAEGEFHPARISDVVHPEDREKVREWLSPKKANASPDGGCFFRIVGRDGVLRLLYGRSKLLAADSGVPERVCGTIQDVTDQVASDRAINEAAHLYRDIFEHCAWGIFQTTPDGRYITANPALARIYGYDSPGQLLSRLTDIGGQLYVDSKRRDEFVRIMKENGIVHGFESQVYQRDGSIIWINETCRAVRTSTGRLLYYEGTVDDISERKRHEEELRAAKEAAEAADRAKTEFLATMSHELRTPLNAVIGFAEIIEQEILGPLSVRAYKAYAGDIRSSGRHLLAVINDILDFVKAEHGELRLDREEIELQHLVGTVLHLLERQAANAGVTLKSNPPDHTVLYRGDERRLQQILINLVGNAIKFTLEGGTVELDVSLDPDRRAIIIVRDTGIGMTDYQLAQIGRAFYQADSSLARRREGTGLGLAITNRLVQLHGGSLSFASEIGKGSTATIVLPGAYTPVD